MKIKWHCGSGLGVKHQTVILIMPLEKKLLLYSIIYRCGVVMSQGDTHPLIAFYIIYFIN